MKLPSDPGTLQANDEALKDFLAQIDISAYRHDDTYRGYRWWQGVPKALVADFLDKYQAHSTEELFSQAALSKFVRTNGTDKFRTWDVVLVNGAKDAERDRLGNIDFIPPNRTFMLGNQNNELRLGGNSARLAGADDLTNVLTKEQATAARTAFTERLGNAKKSIAEDAYYPVLDRPALLIYALRRAEVKAREGVSGEKRSEAEQAAADIVDAAGAFIVAVKIAFPKNALRDNSGDVKYIINSVAQRTWFPDIEELTDEDVDV